MITVTKKVHFSTETRRKRITHHAPVARPTQVGRTPRISKLMALAIRFDGLIREGRVKDMSELARLAHVTQPRMTQIMNLLHLSPAIQEELLFLSAVTNGRDAVNERMLRPVCAEVDWGTQQTAWELARLRWLAKDYESHVGRAVLGDNARLMSSMR